VDSAVAVLRVVVGLTIAAHGTNKIFAGGRISGTAGWFDSIGMRPGRLHAWLAALTEIGTGISLAVGLLTPFAAAGIVALMLVAAWTVHRKNGFFIVGSGWEYNLVLAVSAVCVATAGAGRFSLDHVLFGGSGMWPGWTAFLVAALGGVGAAVAQLATFFRPPVAQHV
jgi:putative oxidoreductase